MIKDEEENVKNKSGDEDPIIPIPPFSPFEPAPMPPILVPQPDNDGMKTE
ncbi:hypothetical protein [Konateibacter massiliensis]|nr:hypothetical protein [Konateibacter massiliensis]